MNQTSDPTRCSVEQLERQVRVLQSIMAAVFVLFVVIALIPDSQAQQVAGTMRVSQLVVEDADGRSRMVLGYLDAPGTLRRFGIRLNDPKGAERFGAAYMENGAMVMGFDAPPGTGDDRNRERINLVADEKGGTSRTGPG